MDKSESTISKEIKDYLDSLDLIHWRNQSIYVRVNGGHIKSGIKGLADITVMLPNIHLYIEVKTLEGKQREAQKDFEVNCNTNGHYYMIARCVNDVERKLEELGVI